LAESWSDDINPTGWWMSEKLDGIRAYWDGKQFLSRNGTLLLAPDWYIEGLPETPLDGELWLGRKGFQKTQGLVMRMDKPDLWKNVKYAVYDAPGHGGEFEARMRYLEDLVVTRKMPYVEKLAQTLCRGTNHLIDNLEEIIGLGGEGLMLREPASKYVNGRSSTLLKVKRMLEAEAIVVDYEPGKGRHKGRVGALISKLSNGKMFNIGTGLSDAQREKPPAVGAIVRFRYQELTEGGVPRFPSYLGIRADGEMTPAPIVVPAPVVKAESVVVPELPISSIAPPPKVTAEAISRTFDYGNGPEKKTWMITLSESTVTVQFGPVDAPKRRSTTHPDPRTAKTAMDEMIAEKIEDGFVERGTTPLTPTSVSTPTPDPAPVAKVTPSVPPATTGTPSNAERRRFEFSEGNSNKFWEVWVEGTIMKTRYGKIGSNGATTLKECDNEAAANKLMFKMIVEKTGKGYTETSVYQA
jgi:DNA ligase-1